MEREAGLESLQKLMRAAPALAPYLRIDPGMGEQLLSGDLERETVAPIGLGRQQPVLTVAALLKRKWLALSIRAALEPAFPYGQEWARCVREYLVERWNEFALLGMHGLVDEASGPFGAIHVQVARPEFLQGLQSEFKQLDRAGLVPDLVASKSAGGGYGTVSALLGLALGPYVPTNPSKWTRGEIQAIIRQRERLRSDAVPAHVRKRAIRFGHGGLDDLLWTATLPALVQLDLAPRLTGTLAERLHALFEAKWLNTAEYTVLADARAHHTSLLTQIDLLGAEPDLLPENPDKLIRLARKFGLAGANEFLARDFELRAAAQAIFRDTLERVEA